jgi:formate hydrogenlyase subunit 3/multisubunit Na+/H+ antiporter MnhD subunit
MTTAAALALLVLAILAAGLGSLRGSARADTVGWLVAAGGALLAAVAGGRGLAGHADVVSLGDLPGLGPAALRVDPLSGLFLLISFGVALPLLGAAAVTRRRRAWLSAVVGVALVGVLLALTADHVFVLLFGWELVTLAFYLLAGYDRHLAGRSRASVGAAVFGKASGAAILLGAVTLAAHAGSFSLEALGTGTSDGVREVAYGLLLFGFAVKVGVLPVQVWLPPTYASAPPAARAVMAGVVVNIGFYGMWRTVEVLGAPPSWLVAVVLVTAGVTAILGISHAATHPELTGLVSWSSVENAGLIVAGFGVALEGAAVGSRELTAAGLVAATAQVVAHSLGKSLLFTGTARVEEETGTTRLDDLRGTASRDPWSGAALVVGALTLAGLPLTAGFASEWLILEALMQQFRVENLTMQLASAVAGALVALTVGVAGVTFVRLVALTAYGAGTEPRPPFGRAPSAGYRVAVLALSAGSLAAAAFAPVLVRGIAAGLTPLVGDIARQAVTDGWVLQPVYPDFSALSPSWLWIVLPAFTALGLGGAWLLSGGSLWRVRRVEPWSSASPGADRGLGYTSFGYANPVRKVLANILLTRGQVHEVADFEARQAEEFARRAGGAPADPTTVGDSGQGEPEVVKHYELDVVEVVEVYLYAPLERGLAVVVRQAKRLQSGRLDAYLTYMLIVLLGGLALVAGLS